ncbi:3826_t:CDS:2, partial [Scutellospora calospora]
MQSPAASKLKKKLKLDDQLCHKHYRQDKRFISFGKDSKKELLALITQHRLIAEDEQPIVHVHNIQLDFNDEIIKLNYQPFNKNIKLSKLDAIVRACDESLLSRDGYRRLAA